MSKKGEVATTEVIIGCSVILGCYAILNSHVAIVDSNDFVLPDEVDKIGDDGLLVEVNRAYPIKNRYYAKHRLTQGDIIYALRAEMASGGSIHATKIWVCTERATTEETENDILQKVTPFYEGISFEGGSCKDLCEGLYAEFTSPTVAYATRRIRDSEGRLVGNVTLIKL